MRANINLTQKVATFPWRLHSWFNKICKLHWRTSSIDKNMEGLRSRYQSSDFFKEILFFFIEIFLSSYVYIKSLLPSRESSNHETTSFVYPSLKVVDSLPFYIPEADHIPLSESYDVYDQSCKPHEVNTDVTSSEHNPMSTSS